MRSPGAATPRVVCVGEGLVVMVAQPGPLEHSDTFERSAGGAEANVARVLAQLDVEASWLSRVGDDGFGRYLMETMRASGVDTSAVIVDQTRTTGMYVKERGSGSGHASDLPAGESRMTYFRSGSAASALCVDDIVGATPVLTAADLVHVSGITLALSGTAREAAAALASSPGLLSFDLNHRPRLWTTGSADTVLGEQVRRSDIVLMGADEAQEVFGTGDPDALRALFPEPRRLVIKNDAHVVVGFDGTERVDVPALRLSVVEKIGAGDAFAGGYLAGVLRGDDQQRAIRLGHLCAAGALTAHGDAAHLLPLHRLDALVTSSDEEWSTIDYDAERGIAV
ncbi:sugar kinase [Rhodococcus sp. SORGH_AS_0301]|uniref:sugar kinase n=1 Tax=Rhodococcus sp. SORGH_AS_0301 TaxID=3041780 RepID=UPI0027821D78|nr:sugar kinase [Rhodococcus sp. SORGH_AS_0301]MDQ1179275.1 2-dehydro-3-deoxygluconokinase [Rhodococcus sp. SORGH_AS_0301]